MKKNLTKPGEFLEKKAQHQRRQNIYDVVASACKEASEKGSSVVEIDFRRFYLLPSSMDRNFYLTAYAFVRVKGKGLVFCEICTKDAGHVFGILPAFGNLSLKGLSKIAAYVEKVEDVWTGEILFFEPDQIYRTQETENSWWRKLNE